MERQSQNLVVAVPTHREQSAADRPFSPKECGALPRRRYASQVLQAARQIANLRYDGATWRLGLFLGLALLGWTSGRAQNLLRNPNFESPLGPDNWTVVYAYGGPSDLSIADRSTFAARSGSFGGHLRSIHDGLYHMYFSQTVTNLTPGARYTVSGYMRYWEYTFELNEKFDVYFSAVGGQGTNSTPNITALDDANLKTNAVYRLYSVTNTATANGRLEVQLHLNRHGNITCCDKIYYVNAMWDDLSVTRTP